MRLTLIASMACLLISCGRTARYGYEGFKVQNRHDTAVEVELLEFADQRLQDMAFTYPGELSGTNGCPVQIPLPDTATLTLRVYPPGIPITKSMVARRMVVTVPFRSRVPEGDRNMTIVFVIEQDLSVHVDATVDEPNVKSSRH